MSLGAEHERAANRLPRFRLHSNVMAKRFHSRSHRHRPRTPAASAGQVPNQASPGECTKVVKPILPLGWYGCCAALIAFQPVATDDLWWQLSRGREVLKGNWHPSRMLLVDETLADADWLGGVPILATFHLLGLAGLAIVRPLVVAALAWFSWPMILGWHWWRAVTAGLVLICASPALEPSALGLDFGFFLLLGWGTHQHRPNRWQRLLIGPIILLLWANLAPRVVLGLLALAAWNLAQRQPQRPSANTIGWGLLLAVVASSLTPRGWWTLADSLRITFPLAFQQGWWLNEGPWASGFTGFPPWQVLSFVALTLAILFQIANQKIRNAAIPVLVGVQVAAWHNVGMMSLAVVPLLFLLGRSYAVSGANQPGGTAEQGEPVTGHAAAKAADHQQPIADELAGSLATASPGVPGRLLAWGGHLHMFGFALLAVLLLLSLFAFARQGLGCGLVEANDIRFLERTLTGKSLGQTAWADSVRTAGMLAWEGRGLKVHDIPHRALLGGRLMDYHLLRDDLRHGRRGYHQRSDNRPGGWWLPLLGRQTEMLLVDTNDSALIAGLRQTIWRPLAIDGPVLALGRAGSSDLNDTILLAMQFQDYVEFGAWQYQPPQSSGSVFDRDRFGLRPEWDDTNLAIRQAELLRAMGLPRAALRVLRHLQRTGRDRQADLPSKRCHADLFDWEVRMAGQASVFRRVVNETLAGRTDPAATPSFQQAATAYAQGQVAAALETLQRDGDRPLETRYAVASLRLESSGSEAAIMELTQLAEEAPEQPVGRLATELIGRLAVPTIQ